MNRARRPTALVALVAILACSLLSSGCSPLNWFGPNFTLSLSVPVGLGGSPGLLNPFGIVQAMVNAVVGGGTAAAPDPNPTAAPSSASQFDPAIPAVLN